MLSSFDYFTQEEKAVFISSVTSDFQLLSLVGEALSHRRITSVPVGMVLG